MKYGNIVDVVLNAVDETAGDVMTLLIENKYEVEDHKGWVRIFEEFEPNLDALVTLLIKTKVLVEKEDTYGMYQVSENLIFKTQVLKEVVALRGFIKLYLETKPEELAKCLEEED